jgi:hypothetical protein
MAAAHRGARFLSAAGRRPGPHRVHGWPSFIFVCGELTGLIGSVSLIEYVFSWNGVGQYGLDAIVRGDFNVVQGYVLLLALFSVAVFLVGDLVVFALCATEPMLQGTPGHTALCHRAELTDRAA